MEGLPSLGPGACATAGGWGKALSIHMAMLALAGAFLAGQRSSRGT